MDPAHMPTRVGTVFKVAALPPKGPGLRPGFRPRLHPGPGSRMDHRTSSTAPKPPARIPDELQALSDTPLTGDPADFLSGSVRDHWVLKARLKALVPAGRLLDHGPGPDGHPEFDQSTYWLGEIDGVAWQLTWWEECLTIEPLTPERLADLEDLARY